MLRVLSQRLLALQVVQRSCRSDLLECGEETPWGARSVVLVVTLWFELCVPRSAPIRDLQARTA